LKNVVVRTINVKRALPRARPFRNNYPHAVERFVID
jgi:hypothetical protein